MITVWFLACKITNLNFEDTNTYNVYLYGSGTSQKVTFYRLLTINFGCFGYFQPTFCETIYTLLEYTESVQFMWMLVEGIHLHNIIAVSFFSGKPNYVFYYILGWGKSDNTESLTVATHSRMGKSSIYPKSNCRDTSWNG